MLAVSVTKLFCMERKRAPTVGASPLLVHARTWNKCVEDAGADSLPIANFLCWSETKQRKRGRIGGW